MIDDIIFRELKISEINLAMEILNQEPFASHDNENTKKTDYEWLLKLMTEGYSFSILLNDEIVGVLFAENIIDDGVFLWLIATKIEYHNKKIGSIFLNKFEQHIKKIGKKWIFLNSTEDSNNFYSKNNYLVKQYKVYECFKKL